MTIAQSMYVTVTLHNMIDPIMDNKRSAQQWSNRPTTVQIPEFGASKAAGECCIWKPRKYGLMYFASKPGHDGKDCLKSFALLSDESGY